MAMNGISVHGFYEKLSLSEMRNWDALLDCLRDLGWIDSHHVVIVHSDVPLKDDPLECRTYLGILQTALADWSEAVKPDSAGPLPEWPSVEHELRVIFPVEARDWMAHLVAGGT